MARKLNGSGAGTYIHCGATNDNTFGEFSLSCWFWLDGQVTNNDRLMARWGANGNKARYLLRAGTHVFLNIVSSTGSGIGITGATNLVTGRWYHVAARMRLGSPSSLEIFLNGVSDASTVFFVGSGTINTAGAGGTYDLRIGADPDSGNFGINGRIAECAQWLGPFSNTDIAALAAGMPSSDVHSTASPVGYWPLWGAAATEPDLEPNQLTRYNGAVTGATLIDHPPVARPHRRIWTPNFSAAPASAIKTIMGVAYPSNVKTIEGLARASVKTVEGLA